MTIEEKIQELIKEYVESPTFKYTSGGSITESLRKIALPNGILMDIQIRITTYPEDMPDFIAAKYKF